VVVDESQRAMQQVLKAQAAYEAAVRSTESRRQERNAAVRAALARGCTHAEVARATGLSRGRIGQIAQRLA
jgi:hypothetical protein